MEIIDLNEIGKKKNKVFRIDNSGEYLPQGMARFLKYYTRNTIKENDTFDIKIQILLKEPIKRMRKSHNEQKTYF